MNQPTNQSGEAYNTNENYATNNNGQKKSDD